MGIIVQKYGGSSVATPAQIKQVAQRVLRSREAGHSVVVVVSAMGKTTDDLLGLANSVSQNPHQRELDMLLTVGERISMALLSMAIHDLGQPAVSFTGSQSGIITTNNHNNARIIRVTPLRIRMALEAGQVVIVAGFQGVSERLEITSLGRGGSDTTAVALAAALGAEYVEICSDVDGIYSGDPHKLSSPKRLDELSYPELQSLVDSGAKMLNAEAVEWARRNGVEIRCSLSTGVRPGTRIREGAGLSQPRVLAVTAHPGFFLIQGERGAAMPPQLEPLLMKHGAVDLRIWELPMSWAALVPKENIHSTQSFRRALCALALELRDDLGLVSVIGRALSSAPDLLTPGLQALKAAGIPLLGQLRSAERVALLVDKAQENQAVRCLHDLLMSGVC